MDCKNKVRNMERCNCTYNPCPRKGICCECVSYHLSANELPACFFSKNAESSYDRSIASFARDKHL
ncbi:MAG: DUF6485 family protein [Candidatus Omnitrophota bacterium]